MNLLASFFLYFGYCFYYFIYSSSYNFYSFCCNYFDAYCSIYFDTKENFPTVKQTRVTIFDLAFRSILTIGIFLAVSRLPKYVLVNFAGIFSAFLTILLPLLLIIYFRHSNLRARTIIKNTPFGLSSIVVYSLVVFHTYEKIEIFLDTILALISYVVYIIFQTRLFKLFRWI